jgi:hypothetical protein
MKGAVCQTGIGWCAKQLRWQQLTQRVRHASLPYPRPLRLQKLQMGASWAPDWHQAPL